MTSAKVKHNVYKIFENKNISPYHGESYLQQLRLVNI